MQPAGVIGAVGENHLALPNIGEQLGGSADVVRLAGRDRHPDRQPVVIGQSMDLCSKASPASFKTSVGVAFFKVMAEWWARTDVPSIIRMSPSQALVIASMIRSDTPALD